MQVEMALYYPEIFNVADIGGAKYVILTSEAPGADTETRWSIETPYVMSPIAGTLAPGPDTLVLDYGCGIDRMTKAMIDATGSRAAYGNPGKHLRLAVGRDRLTSPAARRVSGRGGR